MLVVAEVGYSLQGHPSQGQSFTLGVSTQGQHTGIQQFQPVICGKHPTVQKASSTNFGVNDQVTYTQYVQYACDNGYSLDRTPAVAQKTFTLACNPDSSFSQVPGFGYCANIDDCADHTCGPFGDCVDKLNDYEC